jgi:hypothetical protein
MRKSSITKPLDPISQLEVDLNNDTREKNQHCLQAA